MMIFMVSLVVFVGSFAFGGYIMFHGDIIEFRQLHYAMGNIFRAIVSHLDYDKLLGETQVDNWIFASFYYVVWGIFAILVLSNVFIAILSESYANIQVGFDRNQNVKKILAATRSMFKQTFSFRTFKQLTVKRLTFQTYKSAKRNMEIVESEDDDENDNYDGNEESADRTANEDDTSESERRKPRNTAARMADALMEELQQHVQPKADLMSEQDHRDTREVASEAWSTIRKHVSGKSIDGKASDDSDYHKGAAHPDEAELVSNYDPYNASRKGSQGSQAHAPWDIKTKTPIRSGSGTLEFVSSDGRFSG